LGVSKNACANHDDIDVAYGIILISDQ